MTPIPNINPKTTASKSEDRLPACLGRQASCLSTPLFSSVFRGSKILPFALSLCLPFISQASPLDERIATFRAAATQKESEVADLLKTGLAEQRSAEAFAATRAWLTANQSESAPLLFQAAKTAELAGEPQDALSFYRKFLKQPNLEPAQAVEAATATFRILLLQLNDPDAAYLLMREDGNKIRTFGRARQYDAWFLAAARSRNDLAAVCGRLSVMLADNSIEASALASDIEWVVYKLESFQFENQSWYPAAANLAKAPRLDGFIKVRLEWAAAVISYNRHLDEARNAKRTPAALQIDPALAAASALINASPELGAPLVARGWIVEYDDPKFGNAKKRFEVDAERKLNSLLEALPRIPAEKRDDILSLSFADGSYAFPPASVRKAAIAMPGTLNSLDTANAPLFDPKITIEEARALAPQLLRNPHPHAALVRAFANGERRFTAVIDSTVKTELWRFPDVKTMAQTVFQAGVFERDGDITAIEKKYASLGVTFDQLKKQVAKNASAQDRKNAFDTLTKDLSGNPSIPGALALWNELFANAPDTEKLTLLPQLLTVEREVLFKLALNGALFGKAGRMPWLAQAPPNHPIYHQSETRTIAAALIKQLEQSLLAQSNTSFTESHFGAWLHEVDTKSPEGNKTYDTFLSSTAFAKLPIAYRRTAAGDNYFGLLKKKPAPDVSLELAALAENASLAQIEATFLATIDKASKAPEPATIINLKKVAALPEWSPAIRTAVLSLFRENAPLAAYPATAGYQQLVERLLKDFQAEGKWSAIEPYAASFWSASAAPDDGRLFTAAQALLNFADAAHKAKASSAALTLTRSYLKSTAAKAIAARQEPPVVQINTRLRQLAGDIGGAMGTADIPVDETDPAYPIYKSNAEFAAGNLDSAWQLYLAHTGQLAAVLRSLPVNYAFWLLEKSIEADRGDEAENLIKELTIWSRQAEGTFSPAQDAQLKIAYADLAFRKGALPTARAWYRKVAEAAEYEGTEVHLTAALGSVTVDRVSKNFGAAITELDILMKLPNENFRKKIRYARAEVLMDQESFAEALEEIEQVLRQEPKHPDALILRGKIHFEMRKLVEASEIELGPSQDKTIIVPSEMVKINLRDPTLNVSGIGTDIEVEIWAKSGDRERVLLYQLGDSKEKFRADVATALGAPTPGDKILQILGDDEIRFGYSERFRAKMKDLPADPDIVIGVASDAMLSFSAGAFPPREGERRLNIEELGISSAQAALGTRTVRPGNPVYIRVTDADRSLTTGEDEITVSLQTSSGDEIRKLALKETSPFSGEFQGIVPTAGAQAIAFASESAPGRDPNMAISARDYPGWQGNVGNADKPRTFGIDLNDNAPIEKMSLDTGDASSSLKRFVLQTSLDGKNWTTRARFPEDTPVWDGSPHVSSFPAFGTNSIPVSKPEGRELPADWLEIMDYTSNRASIKYLSAHVKSLSAAPLPFVEPSHPAYGGVIRYRALFYQPAAAIRRFQLTGLPADGNTIFLLNGTPAAEDAENPLLIEREIPPGLHEIQIWRHEGRSDFLKHKPVLLCDDSGKPDLIPCPDAMFDPATFPDDMKKTIPQPATLTPTASGGMDISFGDQTRARLVRLVINGFDGVAPTIKKVTLSNRENKALLPVAKDFMELRDNSQLEVLPGDNVIVRYDDPRTASPKRNRIEQRLNVAFNDAVVSASFLNYIEKETGRELVLEPIRRFRYDDAVAIVIEDPDMDASTEKDIIEIKVVSTSGGTAMIKAVETEENSGRFLGRIFPVTGEPGRASEIKVAEGGTLTATYLDSENLSPGIPTERSVVIQHARYIDPALSAYTVTTKPLPAPPAKPAAPKNSTRTSAPEVVTPRRALIFDHSDPTKPLTAVAGSSVRFDVVVPHLALAGSSTVNAYVQTDAGRKAKQTALKEPYDVAAPGTLKLTGLLHKATVVTPDGYQLAQPPTAPGNEPPLEEGRFSFTIPLILGETPDRSFATKSAESLPESSLPDGLAVKVGDIVHVGYPYQDTANEVKWITASFRVESHPFLDVMDAGYAEPLTKAFVGEKIHLRLIDRGLDRSADRDTASVTLKATSGATSTYELQETEAHSGIFKSAFAVSYAPDKRPDKLPPVALNGFPVRYGDDVEISYSASDESQSHKVTINNGANGFIEPFSKRFTGDEMAVRTSFTLAECYFELAKKHRELDQESLARREMAQARKLLAEAIATHRDDDLRAHAEYLLGNLAQEYADLSKNEEAKLPMYQDALARFSKIPSDYPETEFAAKAQFKTALVYEKMGETQNAVEEYVKLAYKYPNHELIPSVMSRLGGYFQQTGLALKQQADPLREKTDEATKAEVLRLDQLSYPEFLNAAMVFAKLQERFPDDPLAGLAGLRAGQNYMRAHQYAKAIKLFTAVHAVEAYDDREIRSQSLYWSGISQERLAGLMDEENWRGRGEAMDIAYETYRRVTFDFPDSIWAKYARGRLADPAFESRVKIENEQRDRMIESLKESRKNR